MKPQYSLETFYDRYSAFLAECLNEDGSMEYGSTRSDIRPLLRCLRAATHVGEAEYSVSEDKQCAFFLNLHNLKMLGATISLGEDRRHLFDDGEYFGTPIVIYPPTAGSQRDMAQYGSRCCGQWGP